MSENPTDINRTARLACPHLATTAPGAQKSCGTCRWWRRDDRPGSFTMLHGTRVQRDVPVSDEPCGWCDALRPYVERGVCDPMLCAASCSACASWVALTIEE